VQSSGPALVRKEPLVGPNVPVQHSLGAGAEQKRTHMQWRGPVVVEAVSLGVANVGAARNWHGSCRRSGPVRGRARLSARC
jgi:hypothetical protein